MNVNLRWGLLHFVLEVAQLAHYRRHSFRMMTFKDCERLAFRAGCARHKLFLVLTYGLLDRVGGGEIHVASHPLHAFELHGDWIVVFRSQKLDLVDSLLFYELCEETEILVKLGQPIIYILHPVKR